MNDLFTTWTSYVKIWKNNIILRINTKENMRRLMFSFLCFIQVLRVKVSHAQMSRIGYWELAHGQTYSSEDVYGERRDNEQLCCEWSAWLTCSVVSTPFSALCIANEYASNANPLVWYFLNGAFGMFD